MRSFRPSFTFVAPPRSSPNISRPRPYHFAHIFWIVGTSIVALRSLAAASIQRRIGMTPAARWNASSRSIGGIEAAIGAYVFTFCIVSWYFPTRSMNAANAMLSPNESYSRLNAASTCEPVCIERISSTMSCGFVSVHFDQSADVRRWIIW